MIDWILAASSPELQVLVAAFLVSAIAGIIWVGLLPHRIRLARTGWTRMSLALATVFALIALAGLGQIWVRLTSIIWEAIPAPEPTDGLVDVIQALPWNVIYLLATIVVWAGSIAIFIGALSTAFRPRRDLAELDQANHADEVAK